MPEAWVARHARRCTATGETSPLPDTIRITDAIHLPLSELAVSFIRSPGPGGQNVNKVATAAQLRFPLRNSPSLPGPVKARAAQLAGSRLTTGGEIVITASGTRSQQQNHDDAVARLVHLLRQAAVPPKRRVATRPTLGSKLRRLKAKTARAETKRGRASKPSLD